MHAVKDRVDHTPATEMRADVLRLRPYLRTHTLLFSGTSDRLARTSRATETLVQERSQQRRGPKPSAREINRLA